MDDLRVLLCTNSLVSISRNTDMRYLHRLYQHPEYFPRVKFQISARRPYHPIDLVQTSLNVLLRKLQLERSTYDWATGGRFQYVPVVDPKRFDCILARGGQPVSFGRLPPFIYETSFSDQTHRRQSLGPRDTEESLLRFTIERHLSIGAKASRIIISYKRQVETFQQALPSLASKVRFATPFLPDSPPLDAPLVVEKQRSPFPLRLLFVGNQAVCKGLGSLYQALSRLGPELRKKIELTVVSAFVDGEIKLPPELQQTVKFAKDLTLKQVNDLMARSSIFILPTLKDSAGYVVLEAMAKGCVVLTTENDVRTEWLDNGRAGITVPAEGAEKIAESLGKLINDEGLRIQLAEASAERYRKNYAPDVAAAQYTRCMEEVAEAARTRSR